MPFDDPATFQRYEEPPETAAYRLEFAMNVETLQDELRRVKTSLSYDALARMVPEIVAAHAPDFPHGGTISTQNLYDFLKLKSPNIPTMTRRLSFHAFMMVVDEPYREKWRYSHFVKRTGLTLTQFFSIGCEDDKYGHAINLQSSAGLYRYEGEAMPTWKEGFQWRCLLLRAPADLPFLLAYDFDVVEPGEPDEDMPADLIERYWGHVQESWDLDARVGFYIPKRSAEEGVLLLNSFKWDWPTIYAAILNYLTQERIDDTPGEVFDILLTDVNSYLNIDRAERSYLPADYEVPDTRKLNAQRLPSEPEALQRLSTLMERRFDWGLDL